MSNLHCLNKSAAQVGTDIRRCNFQRQTEIHHKRRGAGKCVIQPDFLINVINLLRFDLHTRIGTIAILGVNGQIRQVRCDGQRSAFGIHHFAVAKLTLPGIVQLNAVLERHVMSGFVININKVFIELFTSVLHNVVDAKRIRLYLCANVVGDQGAVFVINLHTANIGITADRAAGIIALGTRN